MVAAAEAARTALPAFGDAVPAAWLQEDPADSLYRAARDALNRRDFEHAAQLFGAIRVRYPRSGYVPDSYYFQALALQREGGREAEQRAIALLDQQERDHPKAGTRADAAQLRARLLGARAQAGDAKAAAAVETAARAGCDQSDQELRATALSALISMDADRAVPILKEILQDRSDCSVQLRRQAVFMIARASGDQAVDILLDLAQRHPDPDPEVRSQAVFWLSRVQSPEAVAALEGMLKSNDRPVQEQAVYALSRQGTPRAAEVLKAFAERADAPKDARQQAIFWLGKDAKNGGPAYLRQLYGRLVEPDLKEQTLFAIAQNGAAEDRAWLIGRVKDPNESPDLRKSALFWAAKDKGLPVAEVRALYTEMNDRAVREQVIYVLSRADDPAAVDALMDIAGKETDKELRQQAVFWLGKSKDPRAGEFLLKLIRGR
jgi:HEAT repeat protein